MTKTNKDFIKGFKIALESDGLCYTNGFYCHECPIQIYCKPADNNMTNYFPRKTALIKQWLMEHSEESFEELL